MSEDARKAALGGISFIKGGARPGNPLASQTGLKSNNFRNAKRRG